MLNFDQNYDAAFAVTTGNGAEPAVVVGRNHRRLPLRALSAVPGKSSRKRPLTATADRAMSPSGNRHSTPTGTSHSESQSSSLPLCSCWQGLGRPEVDGGQMSMTIAPAMWASLRIQQAL